MEPTKQQIEAEAYRRGYEQGWADFNQKHMADMKELAKFYKDKSMLQKEKDNGRN